MKPLSSSLLTLEKALRLIADALLINVSLITALAARFSYQLAFQGAKSGADYHSLFWAYLVTYRNSAWILTLICVVTFSLSGFYTYGRAYQGRYKALIVTQAVSLGYLFFGFITYFLHEDDDIPRGALVLAWVLSVCLLVAARVLASLWTAVVRAELRRIEPPEERKTRNVLVIGGAGYIGSALLPKLLDKGYHVRLLDLLLYGTEPIEETLDHPRLEIMQADFRQVDKVVEAMRNTDAVIHLGAIVGDPACSLDEELTIEVNLMATRMIAEVAKGSGVSRFIFASTCSVYGASEEILEERSELNPVSLYARSKIASERVLMSMASSHFAPTCLRFGTIYGLSGRTRFDLVVNLLTAKAVVEGQITLFGGDQWRPFLHVDDAALAVLKTLEAPLPLVRNQVFNVGSNQQNYTIEQVGKVVQRLVPSARLISDGEDADRRNYQVSFSKIAHTLGFMPQWTLEQGVHQVINLIRNGKVADYQNAKYSNVKFLSEDAGLIRRQNGWAHDLIKQSSRGLARVASK